MDDKLTISTFQLFQMFPDQEAARVYLEGRRWPNGPVCPVCQNYAGRMFQRGDRITARLQRDAILIELNPEYAEMARRRIFNDAPLFAEVQ